MAASNKKLGTRFAPLKVTSDEVTPEKSLLFSPFEYRCNISALHYLKMFLLSVILFPIRLVATGTSFLLALALATAMTSDFDGSNNLKPNCSWKRRILMPVLVPLARFVYFCGGIHWVKIKGQRAPRNEAPIVVIAPHSSFLDSLVVVLMGMTSVVTMTEHADSFIGGLIRVLQPVLVNREDPQSRKKTMKEICYRARSNDNWPQLVIFPEGTCANRTCLVSFKQGAFQPGVPVQPVILRWPNTVDSTTWVWEGPSVLKLLWMTMSQFHTFFEVEFLPVYTPNDEEQLDAQLYANNVRRTMAEALRIPTCDLAYDDFCRIRIAVKCKLPNPEGMVYLYSLIRSAFSHHRLEDVRIMEEHSYREWIGFRLNELLALARNNPTLSRPRLIDSLFPNVQPDQRDMLLLNLLAKHYQTSSDNEVDFRLLVSQACMFFFASDPLEALHFAVRAYPQANAQTPAVLEQRNASSLSNISWEISLENAEQLLSGLFLVDQVEAIVKAACAKPNTSAPNRSCGAQAVGADQLYSVLNMEANEQLYCYAYYESELCRILGSRGRPLIESRSASTSQMSSSSTSSLDAPMTWTEADRSRGHTAELQAKPESTTVTWALQQSNGLNRIPPVLLSANDRNSDGSDQTRSSAYRRTSHFAPRSSVLNS